MLAASRILRQILHWNKRMRTRTQISPIKLLKLSILSLLITSSQLFCNRLFPLEPHASYFKDEIYIRRIPEFGQILFSPQDVPSLFILLWRAKNSRSTGKMCLPGKSGQKKVVSEKKGVAMDSFQQNACNLPKRCYSSQFLTDFRNNLGRMAALTWWKKRQWQMVTCKHPSRKSVGLTKWLTLGTREMPSQDSDQVRRWNW